MNTATTRLMWKEYRAQRDLWLALLIGGGCIQAIFLYSFSHSPPGALIPVLGIVGTWTLIVSLSFTLAATSIAFAGEVDDRTVLLLRMLPCSTRHLMTAKLMTIFLGTLGLLASLSIVLGTLILCFRTGHAIWPGTIGQLSLNWGYWGTPGAGPMPLVLLLISFSVMFTATILISSLLSRKVTTAVAAGSVAAILLTWVMAQPSRGANGDFDLQDGGFQISFAVVGGLLLLVAFSQLAGRWHRGVLPFPERIPTDVIPPGTHVTSRRYVLGFLQLRFSVAPLFQRIAARPESSRRQTAMLATQTFESAFPMAARWLAVSVVLFLAGSCVTSLFPLPFVLLVFFIHECGQKTFREDQRTGAMLMLSHIGVSPLRVWLVRTVIWFSMMLVVAAVFVLLDALVPGIRRYARPGFVSSVETIPGILQPRMQIITPSVISLRIGICVGGILAIFGSGQMMACWIQRQLLAFAGSFLLLSVLYAICRFMIDDFGWSVWLTLVPMSVCLFLATASTAHGWLDRRITRRLRLCQLAWMIGPILLCGMIAREFWYYVPVYNPRLMKQIREQFTIPERPATQSEPWSQVAEALAELNSKSPVTPRPSLDPNSKEFFLRFASAFTREQLKPVVEQLEKLDELHDSQNAIPIRWMAPWMNSPAPVVVCILLEDAQHLQQAGDGVGALKQLVRASRFSRRLSGQTSSWDAWKTCLRFERLALGRLMVVLGEVDLSTADLNELIDDLEPSGTSRSSIPEMLKHRSEFFAVATTQKGRLTIDHQLSEEAWVDQAFCGIKASRPFESDEFRMLSEMSDAEGLRAWKVLSLSGEYYRSKTNWLSYWHASPGVLSHSLSEDSTPLQYRSLSHWEIMEYAERPWSGLSHEDIRLFEKAQIMMDTVALERAAVLSIRLHQYRQKHGDFPMNLWELPSVNRPHGNNPRSGGPVDHLDPWTGTLFTYAPCGTGNPMPIDRLLTGESNAAIGANQAVLISQPPTFRLLIGEAATVMPANVPDHSIIHCGLSVTPEWLHWSHP